MKTKRGLGQVLSVNLVKSRSKHNSAAARILPAYGVGERRARDGKVKGTRKHRNSINQYLLYNFNSMSQVKNKLLDETVRKFSIPLNAIIRSADLIGSQYDTLGKQSILNEITGIKTAATYMFDILKDFLFVEDADKHKVQADAAAFDLRTSIENVVNQMKHQTKDWQDIKYTHTGSSSQISLDKKLLEHCLVNLISNAIKYSDIADHIVVGSEVNDDLCKIWVKDSGIGIPEEEKDRLFEPFFRASNASNIAGTGLGLHLVKRYAELMGGRVTVEKNNKKGTVFSLVFPAT